MKSVQRFYELFSVGCVVSSNLSVGQEGQSSVVSSVSRSPGVVREDGNVRTVPEHLHTALGRPRCTDILSISCLSKMLGGSKPCRHLRRSIFGWEGHISLVHIFVLLCQRFWFGTNHPKEDNRDLDKSSLACFRHLYTLSLYWWGDQRLMSP